MGKDLSDIIRRMLNNHLRITIFFKDDQQITVDNLDANDNRDSKNVIMARSSQSEYLYAINVDQVTFVRLVTH